MVSERTKNKVEEMKRKLTAQGLKAGRASKVHIKCSKCGRRVPIRTQNKEMYKTLTDYTCLLCK